MGHASPDWAYGLAAAVAFVVPLAVGRGLGFSRDAVMAGSIAVMVVTMIPRATWLSRRVLSGVLATLVAALVLFSGALVSSVWWASIGRRRLASSLSVTLSPTLSEAEASTMWARALPICW
ncbi:MAG: hypothetical protein WCP28_17880, partial [Actinomycetes bacterium]